MVRRLRRHSTLCDALTSVVSDVSVTSPGLLAAAVAVLTTCGQQVGVSALLKRHAIASGDLVNYVFPWQVGFLAANGELCNLTFGRQGH